MSQECFSLSILTFLLVDSLHSSRASAHNASVENKTLSVVSIRGTLACLSHRGQPMLGVIFALYLLTGASTNAFGQTSSTTPKQFDLIQELLGFPAPPPQSDESRQQAGNARFAWNSPPPDDAPLEVLGLYWGQIDDSVKESATQKTRERLIDACAQKPELTASLLKLLPQTPPVNEAIKHIYDENGERLSDGWRDEVKKYLKLHTRYFRDELVADALGAKDDGETGGVTHEDELRTLAELDWTKAEPILKEFAEARMPRRAVLAKTLLYRHYSKEDPKADRLYSDLKNTVENQKALGYSRDRAAEALLSVDWTGRDEWFLKLFSDPTLRKLHDGFYLRRPLVDRVGDDADHWIPVVTKLIGNADRAVHDNAVECLIQFQLRNARRDALTPLLPWLFDPKWSSASDRLRLIQSVDELDIRESIPGLIAVLNQKVDEAERAYAANSLVHFRDPRAIPELRRGVPSIVEAHYRRMFIAALIAAGGLSDSDAASAVEAYAAMKNAKEGAEIFERADYAWPKAPLPAPVSIGQYLAEREAPSEGAMSLLLSRAAVLQSDRPLADLIRDIVHRWPSVIGDRDIAQRIQDESASAHSVLYALRRRDTFSKNCPGAIGASRASGGTQAGLFAVLSGDSQREQEVLSGSDTAAVQSLLASARLVRESLPLDQVAQIYNSGETQLARVAGAYLVADDSPRARQVFSSKSQSLVIVGARQGGGDPGHHSYQDFDKRESELLSLMASDDSFDEVLALLTAGYWGDAGQIVVGRKGETSTITFHDDPARRYRRTLRSEELKTLTDFVTSEKVDDLGPLSQMVFDGMQYEYVHLTNNQGRRVFMNNPGESYSGGSVYDRLCGAFHKLLRTERLAIEYPELTKLPGFEVVIADERFHVMNYWKVGSEERLRIYPGRDRGSGALAFSNLGSVQVTSRIPESEGPAWISIQNGTIITDHPPAAFPSEDPHSVVPEKFQKDNENRQPSALWMLTQTTAAYRVGEFRNKQGFWRFEAGKNPKLLVTDVQSPAVSSDGKWALLAKSTGSWVEPNVVVRVNLASGAVLPVAIPKADTLNPIAYISERKQFLVVREKDPETGSHHPAGPDKPEHWLVDPETGKAEVINGEIRPFTHIGSRPLQPTGDVPGQYWAAIPNEEGDGTDIGQFDAKSFQFSPKLHVPALQFNSQALWVDAAVRIVYITYNSHLLRISLPH